ncbi:pseudaminic acid biosynthesis-associated methylase [Candidatus Thiosymbion oneisti]|uniref:pseudaminic acid biosynthesis-associated methylase n=1 Tax=Candidatus Thiosymbion oneisti TaxID=589554 RepID=UPI000B2A5C0C|nr:pseudaminic acid biosynthesis-associated methylase [Candidatus Thiosymbion oneisti]
MYSTTQEQFWAKTYGDEYTKRNMDSRLIVNNVAFFLRILRRTGPLKSVIELGANIGFCLRALRSLLPDTELSALEINESAADVLESWGEVTRVYRQSLLEFEPNRCWDLAFTKGVLIHINPEKLSVAYDKLYASSGKYVLVAEYYNPKPVTIPHQGHTDTLFKRDFAGELLDRFSDLRLIDYGFVYRRDPVFPQDDVSWFLMEKR